MKRLVGGDYLLDLSPIEIEESVDGETYTSITDKSVLDQLTDLKAFIGKSGMIKPVWIKILNGETDEIIVTRGSLSTSDGVTFLIKVLLAGFILTLSVEFTQAETDDHTPLDEWYIDSNDAKYILVSKTQSLAQELADFEGDVNITGDVFVTGDTEFDGDVGCFENIVDKNGHKRFLEGDFVPREFTGFTYTYAKWSLSGSHLMIVLCFDIAANTSLEYTSIVDNIGLPSWIMDKISDTGGTQHVVSVKYAEQWEDSASIPSPAIVSGLAKPNSNTLGIAIWSNATISNTSYARIQFDLLIDNETPAP